MTSLTSSQSDIISAEFPSFELLSLEHFSSQLPGNLDIFRLQLPSASFSSPLAKKKNKTKKPLYMNTGLRWVFFFEMQLLKCYSEGFCVLQAHKINQGSDQTNVLTTGLSLCDTVANKVLLCLIFHQIIPSCLHCCISLYEIQTLGGI